MADDVAHTVNNALAAVSAGLEERPEWARRVLADVGAFVDRATRSGSSRVPLTEEIEHVRCFLRIQTARYEREIVLRIEPPHLTGSVLLDSLREEIGRCIDAARATGELVDAVDVRVDAERAAITVGDCRAAVPVEGA